MSFLPENYDLPQGNYAKIDAGDNRFRILGSPAIGWIDWDEEKKAHRFHNDKKPTVPLGKDPIKHFWAIPVYNYATKAIQILEITQKGLMASLMAVSKDPDWGSPVDYDIKINKKGEKKSTEYTFTPCPKKPLDLAIAELVSKTTIRLDAIFADEDPFLPF